MKSFITALMFVVCAVSGLATQKSELNKFIAKTDSPVIFDKDGAGLSFPMTKKQYTDLMERFSKQIPDFSTRYVPIKNEPAKLTANARYGINFVMNDKNTSWIMDGDETKGYVFYLDTNADGNLQNEKPIILKKVDEKYQFEFSQNLTDTTDGQKQTYPFHLKVVVSQFAPPGETEKKLAILYYTDTIRTGTVNINGHQMKIGVVGSSGIYNTKYNTIYFDLNGNNDFEIKDRYSAERYKVPEKYINIDDKTYEFSVDRHGNTLTLTELAEKLTPRVDLSIGYQSPDFSFTDLAGETHNLSDFRGKIVLLDFWGTWCAPCVAEAPKLAAVYQKLKDKGFEIISLAKEDKIESIKIFISSREMNWYHSLLQEDTTKLYRVQSYPTYFLIDKKGKILSNKMKAGDEMYKKIEELLAN